MTSSNPIDFARIVAWDNLWAAYRQAARGKRARDSTARFEHRLADRLLELQDELQTRRYRPGLYRHFFIHEGKRRKISAAPFRDRVVHHALCNAIEPAFEHRFIVDSYANRVGKGTHRAVDRLQQFARRYRYVLRLDIVKHFPSLDHAILRERLAEVIGDDEILWLVDTILASGVGVLDEEYSMVWFPGDDLLAACRPRGLPIGNLTSQFWSNGYLDPFDHFVERELRCPVYVRYVDDFALFGDSKRELWGWKRAIVERLARLRLTVHAGAAQADAGRDRHSLARFRRLSHPPAGQGPQRARLHPALARPLGSLLRRRHQLRRIRRHGSRLDQLRPLRRYLGLARARARTTLAGSVAPHPRKNRAKRAARACAADAAISAQCLRWGTSTPAENRGRSCGRRARS